jgi:hypothetical protein
VETVPETAEDAEAVRHLAKVIRAEEWYEANKARSDFDDQDGTLMARIKSLRELR